MAAISGWRRTVIYLYNPEQSVNEYALMQAPIIGSLYGNTANYLVNDIKYSYITFAPVGSTTGKSAIMYELFLTATGDNLFTAANLATLQSQLGVSSLPTWTESITWGA